MPQFALEVVNSGDEDLENTAGSCRVETESDTLLMAVAEAQRLVRELQEMLDGIPAEEGDD